MKIMESFIQKISFSLREKISRKINSVKKHSNYNSTNTNKIY